MRARAAIAALCLAWLPLAAAGATPACSLPDTLALGDLRLPAVASAVKREARLVVLSVGGASVAGAAAGGPDASYPAQLQAAMAEQLAGVTVSVINKGAPASLAETVARTLPALLAETRARLVLWSAGAREAAIGADIDSFAAALRQGIAAARQAGANVILLDMQYAPSIERIMNSGPYREALHRVATAEGVAVLERYALMMHWNDSRLIDLDTPDKAARQAVARQVFGCVAAALAGPILRAAR